MTAPKDSPTIRDVARLAQVSVATVSRYLNNAGPVSADAAGRVRAAMQELRYAPHPIARNLATNRTNTIGLVLDQIAGEFFAPLLDGILEVTDSFNYNLLVFTSRRPGHHNRVQLGPSHTDGLLVFLDGLLEDDLRSLHAAGHPIVLIHQSAPPGLHIPTVTIENKAASERLVAHLIEHHHRRRIVFLQGPAGNEDSHWRETGYREALAAHGLPVDPALLAPGEFDRFTSQKSIQTLLRQGIGFDAVFTGDDESAIGVLQALHEAGISVPDQVSVAGFDDQELAPFLNPPLTTVHAPTAKVGAAAANQLIRLIRGQPADPVTLLPTELVLRGSCGCPGASPGAL